MVPITTWVGGSNKDLSDGYNNAMGDGFNNHLSDGPNKDLDGSNTNLG